nr:DUF4315 family protein [uncultured Shuttleworthia sp.]
MYEKLEKLRAELRRAEKRKKDADLKLKTAQERLKEAENAQILSDVGTFHMTPKQVAEFLKLAASGAIPGLNPDGSVGMISVPGSADFHSEKKIRTGKAGMMELIRERRMQMSKWKWKTAAALLVHNGDDRHVALYGICPCG